MRCKMPRNTVWSVEEQNAMKKYFSTNITEMTLFRNIHKINPKRTYEAMMRRIRLMKEQGWERNKNKLEKSLKVGYLDIEASSLNANFGIILSWFIKERGKEKYDYAVIKKEEIFNYSFDKRVVKELLAALKKYDVLYAHYGDRFDFPFIRTRAFVHNLEKDLPEYMETFIRDTWPIAKYKLRLHSNRLGAIAETLGITEVTKTPVSGRMWELAKAGHPKALQYVKDHNKKDVQILERVQKKLERIEKASYKTI